MRAIADVAILQLYDSCERGSSLSRLAHVGGLLDLSTVLQCRAFSSAIYGIHANMDSATDHWNLITDHLCMHGITSGYSLRYPGNPPLVSFGKGETLSCLVL